MSAFNTEPTLVANGESDCSAIKMRLLTQHEQQSASTDEFTRENQQDSREKVLWESGNNLKIGLKNNPSLGVRTFLNQTICDSRHGEK